jgi:hypothetical protein
VCLCPFVAAAEADEALAALNDDMSLGSATSLMSSSYSSIRSLTSLDKMPVRWPREIVPGPTFFAMSSRSRSSHGWAAS